MELNNELIRDLISRTLHELGLVDVQPTGESLLTLAGYYVGREFRFEGVRAVWMSSLGQIKFYRDDGQVLRIVEVDESQRSAA
jgi:hypothetical protein